MGPSPIKYFHDRKLGLQAFLLQDNIFQSHPTQMVYNISQLSSNYD